MKELSKEPVSITKIDKETIDDIFSQPSNIEDCYFILKLYELVIPKFDDVINVGGFPIVGEKLGRYIMDKAIEAGNGASLAWMNNGFSLSRNDTVPDWAVDTSKCKIKYNET